MKQYLTIIVLCVSFLLIHASSNQDQQIMQNQLQQLQLLKQRLSHIKPNHALFDQLQQSARYAGQVATTMVSMVHNKKEQTAGVKPSKLNTQDQNNIIQLVVAACVLLTEFARYCHEKRLQKKVVHAMTYSDFVALYPQLVLLQYYITLFETLIQLSQCGNCLEQIFARITLTGMALPHPYSAYTNKQAKKMYQRFFDHAGRFVDIQVKLSKHPYKKFKKKVSKDWKVMLYKYLQNSATFEPVYESVYKPMIENDYNKSLLALVDGIWKQDAAEIKNIATLYPHDELIKKLVAY